MRETLRSIGHAIYRMLFFNAEQRMMFLFALESQVNAGLPLSRVIRQLGAGAHTKPQERLIDSALSQEMAGDYYTSAWGTEGLFPRTDAALLTVAEQYSALDRMTAILREKDDTSLSYAICVIQPNVMIGCGALMSLAILLGLLTQESTFMRFIDEPPAWIVVGHTILDWGIPVLLGMLGIYLGYEIGDRIIKGERREQVKRYLHLYINRDRKFALTMLRTARHLIDMGVSGTETFRTIERIYSTHPAHREMIADATVRIDSGGTFVDAIDRNIVEHRQAMYLRQIAPNAEQEELVRGIHAMNVAISQEVQNEYRGIKLVLMFILGMAMLWIAYLVLPTLLGEGML